MDSRAEVSVGFARFQNDSAAGNVEIAIDASFEQALARPPHEDGPSSSHQESPFTEAPDIPDTSGMDTSSPDTCHETKIVKAPAAWKKFTRAFTNPLFGEPSVAAGVTSLDACQMPFWNVDLLFIYSACQGDGLCHRS